jgi:hypothetical protein
MESGGADPQELDPHRSSMWAERYQLLTKLPPKDLPEDHFLLVVISMTPATKAPAAAAVATVMLPIPAPTAATKLSVVETTRAAGGG